MALPTPSLRKILRDHCSGSEPMRIEKGEMGALKKEIEERIGGHDHIDIKLQSYFYLGSKYSEEQLICSFHAKDGDRYSYQMTEFRVFRLEGGAEDGTVVLVVSHLEATLSSVDEIEEIVLDYGRRLARRRALAAKREKVRHLKSQAVVAQVKALGEEMRFDFKIDHDKVKMKLLIRLNADEAISLIIPFKDFQEKIPHLRRMITTLREFHETGIRFQIVGQGQWGWRQNWITYKKSKPKK